MSRNMQYKITKQRWAINPLETSSLFGILLTDQNYMPEAIKGRVNWGNTSYFRSRIFYLVSPKQLKLKYINPCRELVVLQ